MIESKDFSRYSFFKKLRITLRTLPAEKAFYVGLALSVALLCSIILFMSYLRGKTELVPSFNSTVSIGTIDTIQYTIPLYASNDTERMVSGLLFAGLKKKNIDGTYSYDLANEITISEDGLSYHITLKSVSFSNGAPITADDIIYTYELLASPLVKAVDRVKFEGLAFEKTDDTTFSIILKKPFTEIDEILSIGILSKAEFENEKLDALNVSPKAVRTVTSGPYEISKVLSNTNAITSLNLKSNPYYEIRPYNKQLSITTYPDFDTLTAAYKVKDIDVLLDNNEIAEDILSAANSGKKYVYSLPRITALYLNANKKTEFTKKENRSIIYYAIDRERLISQNLGDSAVASYDLLPASPYMNPHNEDTSTSIFGINGTGTPFMNGTSSVTVVLTVLDNERQLKVANSIRNTLSELGMTVSVEQYNQTDLMQKIRNRDFEMLLYTVEVDSVSDLYAFWHASQRNAPGLNITSYASTALDNTLDKLRDATNTNAQNMSLEAFKKEFYIEYPYIPLYTQNKSILTQNDTHLILPTSIQNAKDIVGAATSWYKQTERVWSATENENLIRKLYNLLY